MFKAIKEFLVPAREMLKTLKEINESLKILTKCVNKQEDGTHILRTGSKFD